MSAIRPWVCSWMHFERTVYAASRSKARYSYWLDLREVFQCRLVDIKVLSCGRVNDGQAEAFRYTAERRGIPLAYIGMKVITKRGPGVIAGADDSANLRVVLEEDGRVIHAHPHYQMTYLDSSGAVVYQFDEAPQSGCEIRQDAPANR